MERGTEENVAAGANGREAPGRMTVPAGSDDSWMRLLGQISPVAIYRADAGGNCTYANERWCELTGLPAEAAMGSGWSRAIHPDDMSAVTEEWKRTCAVGAPFRMEYRYLRPDGSVVWILGQALEERDATGRLVGYIGTTTDTTELHRMREALQRSHAELEERVRERTLQFEHIAGRLLRVQDEERRRLARDLHDSTAQSLAALSINLSMLNDASALPEEKRQELVASCLALARSIERELRTHTYLLHPPLLEDHGLIAALRWFADGFTARSGVTVDLEMDEDLGRLPDRFELTIFRVVQECLSNIHRHSKSPTARIRLRKSEDAITLEVRDAGCGLPGERAGGAGVGIAGMRERLAQIGGTLDIQTASSGVTVTARIPQT